MSLFSIACDKSYLARARDVWKATDLQMPQRGYPSSVEAGLEWEKISQRIYGGALIARICQEMGFEHPEIADFQKRALDALASWPDWRPEGDDFDKNNWSNGYLPGAWGLLGGDAETFREKGTAYIEQLPDENHWIRRSTNHGIVMFATYLLGALALDEEPVGLEVLRNVVARTIGKGCYPEGANYLIFVLAQLTPYLVASWDGSEKWRDHVSKHLPGIEGAKTHLRLAADRDGRLHTTFGDAKHGVKAFRNVIRFANSLSDEGDISPLLEHPVRSDWPSAPLVRNLPQGGKPAEWDHVFDNGFATARTDEWMLWVIGSRCHDTHNADHDCGSFIFSRSDGLYVGEGRGRQAFHHNVPLLKDAPLYPNCMGPEPFRKRWRNGRVSQLDEHHWRVIAPPSFDGCPTRIVKHVRDLHVADDCLVVLDRIVTDGDGEPVINFNTTELSALWGRRFYKGRTICFMEKIEDSWLSAVVIGAGDRLRQDRGLYFRGRRFPFPPLEPGRAIRKRREARDRQNAVGG